MDYGVGGNCVGFFFIGVIFMGFGTKNRYRGCFKVFILRRKDRSGLIRKSESIFMGGVDLSIHHVGG